jgi:hypothetical protein
MSHRHHCHHKHHESYDYKSCNAMGFINPYTIIILILIVLQWFRVGSHSDVAPTPQPGLVSNGGLFIITLFLLAYCSCGLGVQGVQGKELKCKCKYR